MKDKLILKNGKEIEIEEGSSLGAISVVSATKSAMIKTWDTLTSANLKDIKIQTADGSEVGQYTDIVLDNETSTVQSDGSILTVYHLREKTEIELLKEEIAELRAGQEVQDGAISDLGEAVSEIAGGTE